MTSDPRVAEAGRCAVCGWPLMATVDDGCIVGNCSMRPRPARFHDPERAARDRYVASDVDKARAARQIAEDRARAAERAFMEAAERACEARAALQDAARDRQVICGPGAFREHMKAIDGAMAGLDAAYRALQAARAGKEAGRGE